MEVWSISLQSLNFIGPQVRIQVRTENVSVIFFCADFSTFSYLKLAKHSFGGVHKQYGPKRDRGRLFYPMYVMTWFIVAAHAIYLLCLVREQECSEHQHHTSGW